MSFIFGLLEGVNTASNIQTARNTAIIAERMTWSEEKKADYERELARLQAEQFAIENAPVAKRNKRIAKWLLIFFAVVLYLMFSDVRLFFVGQ